MRLTRLTVTRSLRTVKEPRASEGGIILRMRTAVCRATIAEKIFS
jgi:hypothetical protein